MGGWGRGSGGDLCRNHNTEPYTKANTSTNLTNCTLLQNRYNSFCKCGHFLILILRILVLLKLTIQNLTILTMNLTVSPGNSCNNECHSDSGDDDEHNEDIRALMACREALDLVCIDPCRRRGLGEGSVTLNWEALK